MLLKPHSKSAGVPVIQLQILLGQIDKVCLLNYQQLTFHSWKARSHKPPAISIGGYCVGNTEPYREVGWTKELVWITYSYNYGKKGNEDVY